MNDVISRQAAIDAISLFFDKAYIEDADVHKNDALYELNLVPSAQSEIIRCKDCRHFHYDMPYVIQGISILGHEVCDFWGDGCKTSENGFCSYAERRTDG